MRRPTTDDEAYAWHRAVMANPQAQIVHDNRPQCGWYKCRLTRGGIFVPARIWIEQSVGDDGELLDEPRIRCEINGIEEYDLARWWTWLGAYPISKGEFDYLMAQKDWAETYAPNDPAANPRLPLNPLSTPILF